MFRTTHAMSAVGLVVVTVFGCAGEATKNDWPLQAGDGGPMTRPMNGEPPAPQGKDAPTPNGNDNPAPTGGDEPSPTDDDTPEPSGDDTPEPAGGEYTDPTGVWWTEIETVGSETLPILNTLTGAKIRFVMRVEVTGTAPSHSVKFDFCQLQTEWTDPLDPNNVTTIGFRPDTVAAFSETVEVDLGGLSPGSSIPLPDLTFLGGLDESGMDFDDDGDGFPAVTAWVRTLLGIQIEVYETITINASLDLIAEDDDTLAGTLDFSADALILTSNNPIIFAGTVVTITPDSKEVPIAVKRLPGGGDCSDLPSTIAFTAVPPPPPPLIPPADPTMAMPAPTPAP